MSTPLYNKKPDRIFAFGCSLTSYWWSMWPEIVQFATNIKTYNYGRSGSTNHYIANQIVLANKLHKFTKDDLVIVVWTEPNRHENLHNHDGKSFLKWERDQSIEVPEYVIGKMINQHNLITTTMAYLDTTKAQIHYSSLNNLSTMFPPPIEREVLLKVYKDIYDQFLPSFIPAVNFNVQEKELEVKKVFKGKFFDMHPFPVQSLAWLKHVFDYDFSTVEQRIIDHEQEIIDSIKTVVFDPDYDPGPEFPGVRPDRLPKNVYLDTHTDAYHNDLSWHTIFRDEGLPTSNQN